jgi:hypothetical protein
MPKENKLYNQVYNQLYQSIFNKVNKPTLKRITTLMLGIIRSKSASPAAIASSINELSLTDATTESIERRIRLIENDTKISYEICFTPFIKRFSMPDKIILIIDPTTQDDRIVKLTAAIWYRGRALPLAWLTWPANKKLKGDGFWKRVDSLLDMVAQLIPKNVSVICVADRAFGSPSFIDLVTKRNWHYIVRILKTTRCKDIKGVIYPVSQLIPQQCDRAKMHGYLFKKAGWRPASIVAYWGKGYKSPLCLASDLPPDYKLLHSYLLRYPIEGMFRDEKSHGWHWEQGQVTDLEHVERLLICMALATWVTLFVGTQVAKEYLSKPSSGNRRTIPYEGKRSLFELGLRRLHKMLSGNCDILIQWELTHWNAPNWQKQIFFHHVRAYLLGPNRKEPNYCYF